MSQLVLLVRHGQTDFGRTRLAGWTPGVHLNEEGMRQAKLLGERLAPVRLVAVYSSPLERCVETAQPILEGRPGLTLRIEPELGEVKYGSWQGKSFKVLAKTALWKTVQQAPSQARFPGGESIRELQARSVDAVERIRAAHKKGAVAVVCHADVIRVLAAHYLGMHLDLYQRLMVTHASVTAFAFNEHVVRCLRLSDTGIFDEWTPRSSPRSGGQKAKGEGVGRKASPPALER